MSWFTKHFGITLDKHSLGNLVKNVAPAAAFTPLGVLGAGGLATLGDELRGKNLKQSLLSGVENAALGGGLASLGAKVGLGAGAHLGFGLGESGVSAASGGTSAAGAAPGAITSPAAPTAASYIGGPAPMATPDLGGFASAGTAPSLATAAPTASVAPAVSSGGLLSTLGKGASFLEKHPNTASLGLQGLGDIAGAGTDQRLKNAQAALLESQGGLSANELAQRKASQAALSPYWSALAGMPNGRAPVAANPYTTAGG